MKNGVMESISNSHPFLRRVEYIDNGRSPDLFRCNAFPLLTVAYVLQLLKELTVSGNVGDLHPVPF